jgi:hypothetical protein
LFLHKMKPDGRKWMLGLLGTFSCLSFLLLALANPPLDRASADLVMLLFPPSHLVLMVWAGYGLAVVGSVVASWGKHGDRADETRRGLIGNRAGAVRGSGQSQIGGHQQRQEGIGRGIGAEV